MIFDDFKNIKKYNIDKKVLDFILNIDKNIEAKRHIISDSAYINIDEYQTRNKIKLEAHKKYIDIQFMIEGSERVFVTDLADLEVMEKYDENKDVEFYQTPKRRLNSLYLTKNKFIILYPDDVHSPCYYYENEPSNVKKAIVKIKTD